MKFPIKFQVLCWRHIKVFSVNAWTFMIHYRIHGFLLTELTVRKAFQGYVFSLEHWESSNEKIAFRQYLKDGFSPLFPPLTTPLRRSIKIVGHKAFGTSLLHNIKKLWTLDCRTSFVRYTFLQIWIKNNKNAEKKLMHKFTNNETVETMAKKYPSVWTKLL